MPKPRVKTKSRTRAGVKPVPGPVPLSLPQMKQPVSVSIIMSEGTANEISSGRHNDLLTPPTHSTPRGSSLQQQIVQSEQRVRKADELSTDQAQIRALRLRLAAAEADAAKANERTNYYRQEFQRVDNAYNTVLESMHALKLRYKKEMASIHALVQETRAEWTRERHRSAPPPREIVGLSRQIVSMANELQGLLREMGEAADRDVEFGPYKRKFVDGDVNSRLKEISRVAYAFSNKTVIETGTQFDPKTSAPAPASSPTPLTARLINLQTASATLV